MERGGTRAVAVWHRRAGKDSTVLNYTSVAAHQRVGTYWHMLPEAAQARKVIWDGIAKDGQRMIDQAFPHPLREATNKQEMKIELKCGSIWQLVGSDNYNSLIGANPVGVVFSEYSVADPAAWDYIRPILAENGGWALFIYTPRGRNHGHSLYEAASKSDKWFSEILKADDTHAISEEAIEDERGAEMAEEMIEQEFYCSFDAPLVGAYWAKQLKEAEDDGRVGEFPVIKELPVHTVWDIGYSDATAVWFYQRVGSAVHLVDYHEETDQEASYFAKLVKEKGYSYGDHHTPHDAKNKNAATGKSYNEVLREHGIITKSVPDIGLQNGINAARALLSRCSFDKVKCDRGIACLKEYQKKWNNEMKVYSDTPMHNWASHGADAFRYLAVSQKKPFKSKDIKPDIGWVV